MEGIVERIGALLRVESLALEAPVVQLGFLYAVLAILLGVYLFARALRGASSISFLRVASRVKHLEKQTVQLAVENQQLRQQLVKVYDYLVQFEKRPDGTPSQAATLVLSKELSREELERTLDFEIIDESFASDTELLPKPSIRRLSRTELAREVGIEDLLGDLGSSAAKRPLGQKTSNLAIDSSLPSHQGNSSAINKPEPTGPSIASGLSRTRGEFFSKLSRLFSGSKKFDSETWTQLEELLLTSDMGVKTTEKLIASLKQKISQGTELSPAQLQSSLKDSVQILLESESAPEILPEKVAGQPLVIMVVGVNGVGKTTTIGKLAWQFRAQGSSVLVAACDTFRAAAVDQLKVWAERSGAQVVSGNETSKPSTIAYEAVHKAKKEGVDVLIIDTAGRLHTRVNLMNELSNVVNIISRELPGAPHETILVVDASTGQNALQQAIEFNSKAALTGIVVTKLDGTAKGGIVVAIKNELGVPIRYVGVGEGVTDLRLFSAQEFADALFADRNDPVASFAVARTAVA